jgi:PAS domain S-box-containing protein
MKKSKSEYKILIAGDNLRTLTILRKTLEIFVHEFSVSCTSDIHEYTETIREIPDIIILNFDNPLIGGIKAIRHIRKDSNLRNIPVLMASYFLSSEVQQAINAGADDFIRKPVERIELLLRIKYLIHRSKLNNENLRQAAELKKMSLVADRSENSVIITSSSGRLEWANKAFEKLYEYTLDDFKKHYGDNIREISSRFAGALDECIKGRKWVIYENFWITKAGRKKWIQTSLTPVTDEEDEITNFIAIETDITSLKQAQEQLMDQNQDLVDLTVNLEQINKKLEEKQKEVNRQKKLAEEQKNMADRLLLNIFPYEIAEQLKVKGYATPKHYRTVSIMFTDFVNFSRLSEQISMRDLIRDLSMYFEKFDQIIKDHYLEKIKTIGDSYMCAGGLPIRNKSNPIDTVLAALEIQKFINDMNIVKESTQQPKWNIRLGIHTGEVIAGVIGKSKMAYDIWGDAVNTASRMESSGEANKINISGSTYKYVCKYFNCTYRGKVEVRNMGEIDMYFVTGLKKEYRSDKDGVIPNSAFKTILTEF